MSQLAEFQKIFPVLTYEFTPDSLKEQTQKHIQSFKNFVDRLVRLQEDEINFQNVLRPFYYKQRFIEKKRNIVYLLQSVSPCKEIRDAAIECLKLFSDFKFELRMQKDLYVIFCKVRAIENQLSPEYDSYLNKHLLYCKRNGVNLPKYKREKFEQTIQKIYKLTEDIKRNIGYYTSIARKNSGYNLRPIIIFSKIIQKKKDCKVYSKESDDLLSVPINSHKARRISKKYQEISTFQNTDTIEHTYFKDPYVDFIEETIKLRHNWSKILGYKTLLDYILENTMSKNSQTVHEFLKTIISKIQASTKREMKRLLELKKQICEKNHAIYDGKITYFNELDYYYHMVKEQDFSANHEVIQEYFPLDYVKQQIMEIFQTLLHLKFTKIEGSHIWYPEVSLYSVCDSDNSTLLGYFYLDLFKREGKYPHSACFCIQTSDETEIGRQVSCTAVVTHFTEPTSTKPSLLSHKEVITFFHEFGHVMHHICGNIDLIFMAECWIKSEFMEAPSQMFENWAWEKECLKKISCHYQTKECLSDELIDKLIKSRKANIAIKYSLNLFYCMFDHIIHTSPQCDTFELYKATLMHIFGIEDERDIHFLNELIKTFKNRRGQGYQYIWSEVFSHDMFISRFKKEGIFNPSTGLSFRKCILEPGLTQDPTDLLKNFLGREPIQEPFFEHIGIHPSSLS